MTATTSKKRTGAMFGDNEKFTVCPDCGGSGICNECDYEKDIFGYACDVCGGDRDCVVCEGSGEKPEYAPVFTVHGVDVPTLE